MSSSFSAISKTNKMVLSRGSDSIPTCVDAISFIAVLSKLLQAIHGHIHCTRALLKDVDVILLWR